VITFGPLFFKKFSYGKKQPENGCVRVPRMLENIVVSSPVQRALFVV